MDPSAWLQGMLMKDEAGAGGGVESPSTAEESLLACVASGVKPQGERRLRPPHPQPLPCPRCDSTHTKFCYYNNYSLSQPRYFCKTCRRYWTKGGTLRNIPVGGGFRKNKKAAAAKKPSPVSHDDRTALHSNQTHGLITDVASISTTTADRHQHQLSLFGGAAADISAGTVYSGSDYAARVGSLRSNYDEVGATEDDGDGLGLSRNPPEISRVGGLSFPATEFSGFEMAHSGPFGELLFLDGDGVGAMDTSPRLTLPSYHYQEEDQDGIRIRRRHHLYDNDSYVDVKLRMDGFVATEPQDRLRQLHNQGCFHGVERWPGMTGPCEPSATNPLF